MKVSLQVQHSAIHHHLLELCSADILDDFYLIYDHFIAHQLPLFSNMFCDDA